MLDIPWTQKDAGCFHLLNSTKLYHKWYFSRGTLQIWMIFLVKQYTSRRRQVCPTTATWPTSGSKRVVSRPSVGCAWRHVDTSRWGGMTFAKNTPPQFPQSDEWDVFWSQLMLYHEHWMDRSSGDTLQKVRILTRQGHIYIYYNILYIYTYICVCVCIKFQYVRITNGYPKDMCIFIQLTAHS